MVARDEDDVELLTPNNSERMIECVWKQERDETTGE